MDVFEQHPNVSLSYTSLLFYTGISIFDEKRHLIESKRDEFNSSLDQLVASKHLRELMPALDGTRFFVKN